MTEEYVFNPFRHTGDLTRMEKTEKSYLAKAQWLMEKSTRDLGLTIQDPRQTAAWLEAIRTTIAKSTFRQYKSSLMYYFVNILATDEALEAAEYLMPLNSSLSLEKTNRSSAMKAKNISQSKFDMLLNYLLGSRSKLVNEVICWLQAGILCGLRPSEWEHTNLILHDGKLALKIKNGKNSNGRANGDYRVLTLDGMNIVELDIIKKHLYNVKTNSIGEGGFEQFMKSCRSLLSNANRAVFGKGSKHITLYSARHQFAANAKAAESGLDELAAMMGHATDDTATLHYGRKMFGSKKSMRVKPIAEQVKTVRKTENSYFEQKRETKDLNIENKKTEAAPMIYLPHKVK